MPARQHMFRQRVKRYKGAGGRQSLLGNEHSKASTSEDLGRTRCTHLECRTARTVSTSCWILGPPCCGVRGPTDSFFYSIPLVTGALRSRSHGGPGALSPHSCLLFPGSVSSCPGFS